jgi:riboflavin kinase/FMN adenylyltransferase
MSAVRLVPVDDSTAPEALLAAPSALVIGNFDGVHRGHQAVLANAASDARARGLEACALTFDPHPAEVVGSGAPPLLTRMDERVALMGELGIQRVYVRRFDAAFAAWSPERFARDLVARFLRARVVVVGENFRFGARREGDLALLSHIGAELGFAVRIHDAAADARGPYSSTRAREAIVGGDLDEVARVLGRPHALTGEVVHGDERGRSLGFPTANLGGVAELLPPNGVYAVAVDGAVRALGVTNIGVRPTIVDGASVGFASLDELRGAIAHDVERARAMLT